VTAFFWDFDKSSTLTAIIVLIVFLVAYTYERAYFASYFYDLAETYLIIKKHPIMPREVTIPYERISGITIDRDVFDFFPGLVGLSH
jgi:uncharacterized membrane protein YdbT with pleckstrin-like domain